MVIDRLQLYVFLAVTISGTLGILVHVAATQRMILGILIHAPHVFEYIDQEDIRNRLINSQDGILGT